MTREEFIEQLKNSNLSQVEKIARLEEFDRQQIPSTPDLGLGKPTDPANVKEATVGSEDMASTSGFGTLDLSAKPEYDDFDASEELSTADDLFKANLKRAGANLAEFPAFLNRMKFALARAFMSDEQKEKIGELTPEQQDALAQSIGSIGVPGAINIGAAARPGQKAAAKLRREAEELEKNLKVYDGTITETFKEGNIAEASTRLLTQVIGTLPSIGQAMIPYVGIPSIVAGSAAEASREAVYEEGKDITLGQQAYATGIGMSEGLLEIVTKRIGKAAFKGLIGKPKEVVERTIKETALGIVKAGGAEGLSETGTLAINKFLESKYYNEKGLFEMDEQKWNEFWDEAGDTFLIGMASGKSLSGTGAAVTTTRDAIGNRSVRKTLDKANVNTVNEAFSNENIDNDVVNLARNDFAERRLNIELNKKVKLGEITEERSNEIKQNFANARQAVKVADNVKIGETLMNETVSLIQERNKLNTKIKQAGENKALVKADIDRLNEIDNRLGQISSENQLNITTKKVTDIVSGLENISIEIANTKEDADKIAKDKNLDKKASSSQGFILQNKETGEQTIVINKDIAAADQAVNVAAHELLHGVLFNTVMKSPETAKSLSDALRVEINKIDTSILKESNLKTRLDQYKNESAEIQAEETLTLFADAVANGEIKYNESVFTKIGDIVRRLLQQAGLKDIKFNDSRDVFNFIKDYNKSIVKGELTKAQVKLTQEAAEGGLVSPQTTQDQTQVRESKGALDAINNIIPADIKTKQDFQSNAEVFGNAFRATEQNGVINNYVRSRSSSKAQADATIRSIQDRLMNFDPAMNKTFGEFVFANTNFARLDANKQLAQEQARKARETRIDQSTRQIADTQTETATQDVSDRRKINVLKFDKVNQSDIVKDIKVSKGDTFKQVINNNTGNVANKVFDVPADKITSPTKNLTYAKKIVNGIPEASEAGNIQNWFRQGQNAEKFIRILPNENVSESDADINELGENIDVAKDVKGLSIGMKGRVLNYFYNKTNRRSKGLTSQPVIWELKPQFRNPSAEVIQQFKDDLGIKPAGELNAYDRNIGQLLKGVAKTYAQQASLSGAQRILEQQTKTAKDPAAVKKQTASITAAQKSRVVFSKKDIIKPLQDIALAKDINEAAKKSGIEGKVTITDANREARQKQMNQSIQDGEIPSFVFEAAKLGNFGRKKVNGVYVNEAARGSLYYGKTDPAYQAALALAKLNDSKYPNIPKSKRVNIKNAFTEKGIQQSKDNMSALENMVNILTDAVHKKNMPVEDAALMIASSYQATGGIIKTAAQFKYKSKKFEYAETGRPSQRTGVKFREEHNPPASVIGASLIYGIANNQTPAIMEAVKNNYYQTQLSKKDDNKLDFARLDKVMPEGSSILNNPAIRLAKSGIDLSTIINPKTNESISSELFGSDNIAVSMQQKLLQDVIDGNQTLKQIKDYGKAMDPVGAEIKKAFNKQQTKYSKANDNDGLINDLNNHDKALENAKNTKAPKKGISIFDFDDTLATTGSKIVVTMPDGTVNKITPAEFARQHSTLQEQGAEFNFDEFNKVVDGKPALASKKLEKAIKKFGNKDVYVLTARPQQSAEAIYEFLKGIGLEVPLKNITGLEDGTPQAKANWVISKAAEGYNDFYFTDDVYKNVKAVQDALNVLDVKSKSRLAYETIQKKLDKDFNDILEAKTGIAAEKEYSRAKATVVGANKGRFKFFIPPSAEDFTGLLYNTLAKGKLGDSQMAWYKKNLLDPYASAMHAISRERISLMNDYKTLKKQLNIVPKNLRKKIPGETFTNEQAIRVYIWNKQGMTIPDLSKADLKELTNYIEGNTDLKVFADQLIAINKQDGYVKPNIGWLGGTITTDLLQNLGTTKRAKHLKQWQENVDIIFSEKNLNKMEAAFGKAHRVALEGILERMKTGRNRSFQSDSITGRVTDWLTNSIGTIMFFNTRSALLQTISSVNFINFGDNNIFKAGKAFANQKQFWSDFMFLMNSDFLVDRRRGLRINVNEADIANMARQGGARGVISKMLEFGFLPTQIADSFAIASGGASFYRNRVNTYIKQGIDKEAAQERAFKDFREIAEESQQSSRPDRISAQQAGPLGRIILAFGNTPMQYARLIKKASSDLVNRRGDWKTNVSKIIYYSTVQNLIFNALQQAIFAIAFGDVEEEEAEDKYINIANGMADSLLRGTGVAGAFVSVGKNVIKRIIDESEKPNPKYEKIGYELTRVSPPLSSKLSRVNQAARAFQWEQDEMREKGFAIDNPALLAGANIISAATNVPVDRLVKKTNNVVDATSQDLEMWERLALLGGWQDWELGIEEPKKFKPNNNFINRRKVQGESRTFKNVRRIK